jgi:hypothetical protein
MKKITPFILLFALIISFAGLQPAQATAAVKVEAEKAFGKRKKNRGYKKPKSKKILGIFKRKTDCGCPKH